MNMICLIPSTQLGASWLEDFIKFVQDVITRREYNLINLLLRFKKNTRTNGTKFIIHDPQKILGHTILEMTQRHAHLAPEHLVQASNVMSFSANLKSSAQITPSSLSVV